ncbi:MAG TPA: hypothetical protein VJ783_05565 [Pirellulales bacterium]|nr:hypothetical protein [Pirellulales bacterium]
MAFTAGAEPASQAPLEYRRYFVPADRPQIWPKRNVPYLPVDRDEFERLVEAANSAPMGKHVAGAARIAKAVYEAALDDRDRLDGEARFEISAAQDGPTLMPIEPFGFVLERAAWRGEPGNPAVVGVDADGRFSVLVERSGTLVVEWSLVGRRETGGSLVFPMELPRAPVARMQLDLPPGMFPTFAAGVLASDTPIGDRHRWSFELGGRSEASLVLAPDEAKSRHRRLTLLQEHLNYRFTPGGLEVAAQLRLDIHHEPLRRLELDLDAGLRLAAAQQGGTQLAWRVSKGQHAGSSRAVVEFAEPLLGPGRTVTVTALAPMVLEQNWTLPRIRVQGVFWQEGTASLVVPTPLSLDQLLPVRCRQLKSGPLASARPSDTFDLQFFSSDASATVRFSWRKPMATLAAATSIELSGESWQANYMGRFELDEGEAFVLSADVADGWLVDTVVSIPPGAVSTWNVEDAGGDRSLVVQLSEPLAPNRPLELRVEGRRAPADQELAEKTLQMVEFRDVNVAEHLLALAPAGHYQLRFTGAEPPRLLRREQLTPAQRKLIENSPLDAWIDLNSAQPGWAAELRPQPPRYTAELFVDALLTEGKLRENYLIRCKPEGARLDRVLVHFAQSRPTPPRWTADASLGPLTAEKIASDSATSEAAPDLVGGRVLPEAEDGEHGPVAPALVAGSQTTELEPPGTRPEATKAGTRPEATGETWEVRLARPSEKPFELHASRETVWEDQTSLCLAALEGATSQQGMLRIHDDDSLPELAIADRLNPLPVESAAPEEISGKEPDLLRAAYRYDPLTELGLPPPAALVHRSPRPSPCAVVWKLQLHSQYSSSGRTSHTAALQIQNKGQKHCQFRLPSDTELIAVRIDSGEIRPESSGDGLQVALPSSGELCMLSIEFASSGRPLALVGRCQAVWPEIDLPVMSRAWTVSVPPAYHVWNETEAPAEYDLRGRLFGPLGRAVGERPFDPRQIEDWRKLAHMSLDSSGDAASVNDARSLRSGIEQAGWNDCRIESDLGSTATAWFAHRGAIDAARWAIMAIVAGIGLSVRHRRPAALIGLGGIAAAAAIWLPVALAPIASGAWLGVLICVIGWLCRPLREAKAVGEQSAADRSSTSSVQSAAVVAGLMLLTLAPGLTRAADDNQTASPRIDAAADESAEDAIHRVLIPVDAGGKPGTRYQVPTEFLQALRRRAGAVGEQPRGWLLSAARYRCTVERDENESRLDLSELSVEYELRVFEDGTQVRIPLVREESPLVADSATLDRQPIELVWDDKGRALVCDIEEAGEYVLQFRMLPETTDRAETTGLELTVPRVPSARLEVTAPPEAMPIQATGARGATTVAGDGRQVSVELGPIDQLAVRWLQKNLAADPVAEVEELLWLKIQPGSVVLDVRLNYKLDSGVLRRVELAADPRLWRIPGSEGDTPAFSEVVLPSDPLAASGPQIVQLDLETPVSDQLSLNLSWLLTGSSGVGNLRLPSFQVVGARPTKRWLAVTVDSGLEYDIHNDERLEGLPPADFAAAWGGPDTASLRDALAYRLTEAETGWSLATRTRQPRTTAKENLVLSFDRARARIEYDAQLRTTAGFVFEHRLLVPPELRIDQISLEEDGAERVARWARGDSGVVTVFLNRRVTGPQQMLLRGRLPLLADGKMPLPIISVDPGGSEITNERAEVLARTVRIYRQPSVAVALSGVRGLEEANEPRAETSGHLGRLAAAFNATGDLSATLTVAPNEPRIHSAAQLTSLKYLEQSWSARSEVRFAVDDGVLDALRFDVPANWGGPFEVTPEATVEVFDHPDSDRKQLLVRPWAPLHGRTAIAIAAPLKTKPGEPVAAPDVVPLNLPEADRYLALPLHVGAEAVAWDTSRLVSAPLPETLADHQPNAVSRSVSENFALYRAVGDDPQAVLNSAHRSIDAARVRLADIGLSFEAGVWRAVGAFDVEPGGMASCPLRLPAGWQLLEVWVEGIATTPRGVSEGEWRVPLHSIHLPQRVEVIASGSSERGQQQGPFMSLGALPVQDTLLTVFCPPGQTLRGEPDETEVYDPAACARLRAVALAGLIDLPAEVIATTPADELAAWFRPWARRLIESGQSQGGPGSAVATPGGAAMLDDEWLAMARRLHLEPILKSLATAPLGTSQPLQLFQAARFNQQTIHYHLRGAAPPAAWRWQATADWPLRTEYTMLIAAVSLVAVAAMRHPTVTDAWRRWPQLLLAIVGVGWWLWLAPSALGFVLIAVSLWSALRSAWRPAWIGRSAD